MGRGQNVIMDGSLEEADSSPHGDSEGSRLAQRMSLQTWGNRQGDENQKGGLTVTELLPPHERV